MLRLKIHNKFNEVAPRLQLLALLALLVTFLGPGVVSSVSDQHQETWRLLVEEHIAKIEK